MESNKGRPYLTAQQLADRWPQTLGTLAVWRCRGLGPAWSKIGGRVVYYVDVIEAYENKKPDDKNTENSIK